MKKRIGQFLLVVWLILGVTGLVMYFATDNPADKPTTSQYVRYLIITPFAIPMALKLINSGNKQNSQEKDNAESN